MKSMKSKIINGVKVFAPLSRESLINFGLQNKSILVAINAEKILHADDALRNIINRNIGYPDGFGAVLALRKSGFKGISKIPGCELWLDIIQTHYLDKTFYFVGGTEEVIKKTVSKLKDEFQGIRILNYRNGYLKNDFETNTLINDITEKKPDIVFVAMGSPKQELLMDKMNQKHPALYQGLGGSFDIFVGNVKRAPTWLTENNLEWLYRLVQEPKRIVRQLHLFKFLVLLLFKI